MGLDLERLARLSEDVDEGTFRRHVQKYVEELERFKGSKRASKFEDRATRVKVQSCRTLVLGYGNAPRDPEEALMALILCVAARRAASEDARKIETPRYPSAPVAACINEDEVNTRRAIWEAELWSDDDTATRDAEAVLRAYDAPITRPAPTAFNFQGTYHFSPYVNASTATAFEDTTFPRRPGTPGPADKPVCLPPRNDGATRAHRDRTVVADVFTGPRVAAGTLRAPGDPIPWVYPEDWTADQILAWHASRDGAEDGVEDARAARDTTPEYETPEYQRDAYDGDAEDGVEVLAYLLG